MAWDSDEPALFGSRMESTNEKIKDDFSSYSSGGYRRPNAAACPAASTVASLRLLDPGRNGLGGQTLDVPRICA